MEDFVFVELDFDELSDARQADEHWLEDPGFGSAGRFIFREFLLAFNGDLLSTRSTSFSKSSDSLLSLRSQFICFSSETKYTKIKELSHSYTMVIIYGKFAVTSI